MSQHVAAPGELELVRAYVNTLDVESGADDLATPPALGRWLSERGLLEDAGGVTPADWRRALGVRAALRSLLAANNGAPRDEAAPAVLESEAQRARLTPRFREDGSVRLEPVAGGVAGAVGRLLGIVVEAMAVGTWERLKACRAETCRWAFYDRARNRSRTWCSMEVCGNRTKARAFRARRA